MEITVKPIEAPAMFPPVNYIVKLTALEAEALFRIANYPVKVSREVGLGSGPGVSQMDMEIILRELFYKLGEARKNASKT